MNRLSLKYILGLLVIMVLAVTITRPAPQVQAASAGPNAVIAWNTILLRASLTVGRQSPPQSFVYAAYVQAAVYNAVVAIEGGYEPYELTQSSRPEASVDAAVATAAHAVLVHYFPLQQADLDSDYSTFMATVADGDAKTAGIEVGSIAAQGIIDLRQSDGVEANIGFTMPAPAPGVWQLPAGVSPVTPWMSQLQPFMLKSPDQFRPGPPPDLSSDQWAQEYNEVLLYGSRDSLLRTPDQTATARFWTAPPLLQYNLAYQQLVQTRGLGALEAARLMAMGNMVGADTLVACFDAKYHYLFWRPQFAIPQGDSDGNPDTTGDPNFVPLIGTPAHPEYPSAHGCETGAQAEVFAEFLGTQHIDLDIPSGVQGVAAHHFATANDLKKEIINARVWGGIHYRGSDETGTNVGRKVAHWTLKRYFLPTN